MKDTSTGAGEAAATAPVASRPAQPAYEPPAIAWEEPFEPMASLSCAFESAYTPPCSARPSGG